MQQLCLKTKHYCESIQNETSNQHRHQISSEINKNRDYSADSGTQTQQPNNSAKSNSETPQLGKWILGQLYYNYNDDYSENNRKI